MYDHIRDGFFTSNKVHGTISYVIFLEFEIKFLENSLKLS